MSRFALLLSVFLVACTSAGVEDENLFVSDTEDSKADASPQFAARVWATPNPIQAGVETQLQVRFYRNGERVRYFDELHTQPLHLVMLSRDHVDFQHVHPTHDGDGTFETTVTFTQEAPYSVALEFDPAGATLQQVVRGTLMLDNASSSDPCDDGCDTWDADGTYVQQYVANIPTSYRTVQIRRADSSAPLRACEDMQLLYSFRSAAGSYQNQFATWLGMPGHNIVFSEDNQTFSHLHGSPSPSAIPGVVFHANVPQAGRYEAFAQFLLGGEVVTVRQWLEVEAALLGACESSGGGGGGNHDEH